MRQYDERARADDVMRFRLPLALGIRVAGVEHDLPGLAVRVPGQRDRGLVGRGVEEDQERVVGDRLAARAGLGDALAVEEDRERLYARRRPIVLAHRRAVGREPRDVRQAVALGLAREEAPPAEHGMLGA